MSLVLLTACGSSSEELQAEIENGLQQESQEEFKEVPSKDLQVPEEKQDLEEKTIEQDAIEEPIEEVTSSNLELPDDVFIIEVTRNDDGNQEALTLKDGLLQFWSNENMVCEKQIPVPDQIFVGSSFYEVIGNPYISKDYDFALPKPTTIWLNESSVTSVKFGWWGTTSYGYQDVSAISVRLYVESYGELDIANAFEPFDPIEVDNKFSDLLYEKFPPQEYKERLSIVMQTLNEYKRKSYN